MPRTSNARKHTLKEPRQGPAKRVWDAPRDRPPARAARRPPPELVDPRATPRAGTTPQRTYTARPLSPTQTSQKHELLAHLPRQTRGTTTARTRRCTHLPTSTVNAGAHSTNGMGVCVGASVRGVVSYTKTLRPAHGPAALGSTRRSLVHIGNGALEKGGTHSHWQQLLSGRRLLRSCLQPYNAPGRFTSNSIRVSLCFLSVTPTNG